MLLPIHILLHEKFLIPSTDYSDFEFLHLFICWWEQWWHIGESTRLPPIWSGSYSGVDALFGLILVMVLSLMSRGFFFLSISILLKHQHFQIPIRPGMVDEQPLLEFVIAKSLFIYLFIYLFVALQIVSRWYQGRDHTSLAVGSHLLSKLRRKLMICYLRRCCGGRGFVIQMKTKTLIYSL